MTLHRVMSAWVLSGALCLLALTVAACVPVTAPAAYDDPFGNCTAVGAIDAPDEQYTGPAVQTVCAVT